jgi:hypothetical protein
VQATDFQFRGVGVGELAWAEWLGRAAVVIEPVSDDSLQKTGIHAELAGKLLANKREAIRLRTAMMQVEAVVKMLQPGVQRRQHRCEAPQQVQSMVQARDAI